MKCKSASSQLDLFEQEELLLSPLQKEQLAALVEALLREIAVALAAREVGDNAISSPGRRFASSDQKRGAMAQSDQRGMTTVRAPPYSDENAST